MQRHSFHFLFLAFVLSLVAACSPALYNGPLRTFATSFESLSDFQNASYSFYLTPQAYKGTSWHELSTNHPHSGTYAHRAWVVGTNAPSTPFVNNNHRGYPTIQLQKTPEGAYRSPVFVRLWVWLDMTLSARSPENDWFSFVTLTSDSSDSWSRTVLLNVAYDGIVHLMHVPNQGEKAWSYQNSNVTFPMREWVKLEMAVDFDGWNGKAKAWMNGVLVSEADVRGTDNRLSQAHFGLYCSPQISSGEVYNDDLEIFETNAI